MAAPKLLRTLAELRAWAAGSDRPVHFVPTMGNLHQGHLSLVAAAAEVTDQARVIVSIFVNPTQFGPNEDFERYPRTLQQDLDQLAGSHCEAVWLPDVGTVYPFSESGRMAIQAPRDLSQDLCGAGRPGHFDGVVSVVLRLFAQVQPSLACFGEKDFQQLQIIRRMVQDLSLPIAIHAVPTHRESDGLAMSSRNQYLNSGQRNQAVSLYAVLQNQAAQAQHAGDWGTLFELERSGIEQLEARGLSTEYFEFRQAQDLSRPDSTETPEINCLEPDCDLRLLAAVRLGTTRLIDNVAVARQICR